MFANREAYNQNKRFIDENLNRSFIENKNDNIEGRRAKEIEDYINNSRPDFILDLHSVSIGDLQMAVINSDINNEEISNISNTNIIVRDDNNLIKGSTITMASRYDIKVISIECGNHSSENCINVAMSHIYISLSNLDMIDINAVKMPDLKLVNNNPKKQIYTIHSLIIPSHGFKWVVTNPITGTFVKAGEVYAISDNKEYIVSEDLYLLMPSKTPDTMDTDAGFLAKMEEIE